LSAGVLHGPSDRLDHQGRKTAFEIAGDRPRCGRCEGTSYGLSDDHRVVVARIDDGVDAVLAQLEGVETVPRKIGVDDDRQVRRSRKRPSRPSEMVCLGP